MKTKVEYLDKEEMGELLVSSIQTFFYKKNDKSAYASHYLNKHDQIVYGIVWYEGEDIMYLKSPQFVAELYKLGQKGFLPDPEQDKITIEVEEDEATLTDDIVLVEDDEVEENEQDKDGDKLTRLQDGETQTDSKQDW